MAVTDNYQRDTFREVATLAEADRDRWRAMAYHIANRLSAYTGLDVQVIISNACDRVVRGE